jgi:hypothetical protein
MIYRVMNYIAEELNAWIKKTAQSDENTHPAVTVDNLSNIHDANDQTRGRMVLSLLNVLEDSVVRSTTSRPPGSDDPDHPAVDFQYLLLFTACNKDYKEALEKLSRTIEFFSDTSELTPGNSISGMEFPVANVTLVLEMQTLTTQELNQIWSVLKVRLHPFVCYKLRLIVNSD